MPYRREKFANAEIYHIVIRGIDDNLLFKNIDDHYRGIFSIYEFNTTKPVNIRERRIIRLQIKKLQKQKAGKSLIVTDNRDKLVEILAFCFMPNHVHLLLRQLKDGGITKFMKKVGAGYGGYFNRKYHRRGYVFQDRFHAVRIKTDAQLLAVFNYIHTNPLSLTETKWKEGVIKNIKKSSKFLFAYKWSSYRDYIGQVNFPSITERGFLLETLGGENSCQKSVEDWVKNKKWVKGIDNSLFLE